MVESRIWYRLQSGGWSHERREAYNRITFRPASAAGYVRGLQAGVIGIGDIARVARAGARRNGESRFVFHSADTICKGPGECADRCGVLFQAGGPTPRIAILPPRGN